jgi:transcription antitermination factor NusG
MSRREKELMRRLRKTGIDFYCPLIPRRNRAASGRVRTSYLPLFPGYVFLCGNDDARQVALSTQCVSRTIPVADTELLVHDLRQVQQLIASGVPLSPEGRIQPGHMVRVKNGPLMGIEGTVAKRFTGDRLIISVQFLQQGASVAIDDFSVEPI